MQQFDILIIGNGILGLSTAFEMAITHPTIKIGIIGPSQRNGAATAAAGAMLGCFGEITDSTFNSPASQLKFELNREAKSIWPDWLSQINEFIDQQDHMHINPGTFILLNSISGKLDNDNFDAIVQGLDTYHEPYNIIDPYDIPGLDPIPTHRPIRAMYLPNEGSLNAMQFLQNIQSALLKLANVKFIDGLAKQIVSSTKKIDHTITDAQEKIAAPITLLCTGAYSSQLLDGIEEIRYRIPKLFYGVGTSITFETNQLSPIKHVIRTPNRSFACGLHIVPHNQYSLYVGATNNVEMTPEISPRLGISHFLLQCTLEQVNQNLHNAKIIKYNVGNRPVALDTFPLIGSTSIKGLWLLTGTYRDGFHCAPALAKLIASQLMGNAASNKYDLFTPERFPIQTMTKEQSIEEAVKHYMAGGYEHAMKLPRVGWDNLFEDMLRTKFTALINELNLDFTLSPDLFLMFDQEREKHIQFFQDYNQSLKHAFSNTNAYNNHSYN